MSDLEEILKEISNKKDENKKDYNDNDFWVMSLLMFCLLGFPQKEEKQPIINIYIGGE